MEEHSAHSRKVSGSNPGEPKTIWREFVMEASVSQSRMYVAVCNKTNFNGFYLRLFYLPEQYDNNSVLAKWYFLNELNYLACLEMIMPLEEYFSLDVCENSEKQDELFKAIS